MKTLSYDLALLYRKLKRKGLVDDNDFLDSHSLIVKSLDKRLLNVAQEEIFLAATEHCLSLAVMRVLRGESSKRAFYLAQIILGTGEPIAHFLERFEPLMAEAIEIAERKNHHAGV